MDDISYPRAIGLSFLGLVVFYITVLLFATALICVIWIFIKIPVLDFVATWISRFLDSGSFLLAVPGYIAALNINCKLAKTQNTADLACVLTGAYMLIISVISLVLDVMNGYSVWNDLLYGVAGIVLIVRRSSDIEM